MYKYLETFLKLRGPLTTTYCYYYLLLLLAQFYQKERSLSEFLNGSYPYLQSFDPPTEEEIKDIISYLKDPAACHHEVMSSLFINFRSLIIKPVAHTFSKNS